MTAIIILNIAFSAFVVVGILGLMGWGIATDRVRAHRLRSLYHRGMAARHATERRGTDRRAGADRRFGPPHPAR